MEVGAKAVKVGVSSGMTSVDVGTVGVDKTSTEKVHPVSKSAVNTQLTIDPNHLRCFIEFSLSETTNNMESDKPFLSRRELL